jgi:hypothetical protein
MDSPVHGTPLDAFSAFGRFELPKYYAICFGILPSTLKLNLPLERSKDAIDSILEELNLEHSGFQVVFKNWITNHAHEPAPNPFPFDDLAVEYVFKNNSSRVVIDFTCHMRSLEIEFMYDIRNQESEKWILDTSRLLQEKYKAPNTPKFKVLIHQDGMFATEDVNTGDFHAINIAELYNDDFIEIDRIIAEALQQQESGMVLLHGEPGTGKTTYIKHLISKHSDKQFIFIQNDFVRDLLKPSFISFLLQNKNAVLIIEDAEKVVMTRDHSVDDSVVSTILQLTDGLFSDFLNIKIICTFNTNIERIDKALLRKGRMIAKYKFSPLTPEKTATLAKQLGHENISGSLTLADIFGLDKRGFDKPARKAIGFSQGP